MIKPIYLYGADVLRRTAEPADLKDKEGIAALVQDLKDTLKVADGCGLAAPQIGVSKRVVIVDGDVVSDVYDYLKGFRRTIINPEILEESDEKVTYSEGCLSIPGIYC
ncbi:MAG: peptide deformylase, partial [Bacteroidales bacterium]|nr:peptide deformylase [Bacteroidales bacterium]